MFKIKENVKLFCVVSLFCVFGVFGMKPQWPQITGNNRGVYNWIDCAHSHDKKNSCDCRHNLIPFMENFCKRELAELETEKKFNGETFDDDLEFGRLAKMVVKGFKGATCGRDRRANMDSDVMIGCMETLKLLAACDNKPVPFLKAIFLDEKPASVNDDFWKIILQKIASHIKELYMKHSEGHFNCVDRNCCFEGSIEEILPRYLDCCGEDGLKIVCRKPCSMDGTFITLFHIYPQKPAEVDGKVRQLGLKGWLNNKAITVNQVGFSFAIINHESVTNGTFCPTKK